MRIKREAAVDFQGPGATDFDNVRSLNRAFIRLLRSGDAKRTCLQSLPGDLAACISSLPDGRADRLATTPFLLLSFRERDDDFWEEVFSAGPNRELFAASPPSDDLRRLISAGLGFVWQLAMQNPYAARLICGASLHWCERLAERTLFRVLATAGMRADILMLRCGSDSELWSKLLSSGTSRENEVRRAAHISALQAVLTRAATPERKKWAAAACALRSPSLRVADDR
ncbi:MAG: hypothetical protein WD448_09485 [Woeseia sp.]